MDSSENSKKFSKRETLSYLICGGLTTLVGLAVFWLCENLGFHVLVSNSLSHATAVLFAYFVNKILVFRSASWQAAVLLREVLTFISGRLFTYISESLLLVLLISVVGLNAFACKLFTTVLVVVGNYFISKKLVFGLSGKS